LSLNQLFKNSKFRYILYVFVAQGLFVLCNLYINHWINKSWHVEGFAIFNLVKRISSFVVYPLLIGAGIGIPRYISFLKSKSDGHGYEYLISGIFIFLSAFLAFTGFVMLFPSIILKAFTEFAIEKERVLFSILLFALSQGIYILLTSYYRGKVQFGKMSFFNVLIMSLLPLSVLFFVADIFSYFFFYSLISLIIISTVVVYYGLLNRISFKRIKYKSFRLLKYGYPRIVGELGLFSLEFMPVFLVSLYVGLAESGYISMTFILLKLGSTLYELIGSLVLPYFGRLFKNSSKNIFISKVNHLLIFGIVSSMLIMVGFYFFIPVAIRLFFPSLLQTVVPSQMIFIVFPIFTVYLLLRNILDIIMDKAYNSINLSIVAIIQVLILALGIYFKNNTIYYVLAIAIPYLILGLLSYLVWVKNKENLK
jgi:O-antigen/teichoic acid export membrane protein